MEEYWRLNTEWYKIYDIIHHYNIELDCLPKCDYSYETEQELRERYTKKLDELYAKADNIGKQMDELYIKHKELREPLVVPGFEEI